ncbi:PTPA-CTERM sorting domain-containing protein [Thermoleptolyngbya oregonensis]
MPTPAMLPGLVGMGLAALKKRKEQNDQDNDSTV